MVNVTSGTPRLIEGTQPTNVTGTVKTGTYSDYIPHPAFEFDGAKAGIWVGKYEPSGSTTTVTIKPNVSSLRSMTVSDMFTASQGVKTTYGLSSDSHMMKNTEWGAVAYLTESKYGRNGTEVGMNSSNYTTGGGDYKSNVLQSTTGNIYGIYDLNGGAWEYVAGYINNSDVSSNGNNTSMLSADVKYRDVYTQGLSDTHTLNYSANKGIKGDATYETSTSYSSATSWHADSSYFPNSNYTVFERGRLLQ